MVIHPIVLDSQAVGFWRPVAHRNGIAARPTLTIDLNARQRQPSRRPSPATPTSPASPLPSAGQGGELTAVVPLGLLENRDVACRGGALGASVAAALAAEQALWVEHAGGQRGTICASRQCLRRNAAASAPWRRAARWPDPDWNCADQFEVDQATLGPGQVLRPSSNVAGQITTRPALCSTTSTSVVTHGFIRLVLVPPQLTGSVPRAICEAAAL
jgi:hypothetical protein